MICFAFLQLASGALYSLSPQYQFSNVSFNYQMMPIDNLYCYTYGIFTRYNPLTDIQQLGEIGILDSNCDNIHHTIDKVQSTINFLYYDCIDYKNKQIEKSYIFIGDEGNIYKHSYQLNIYEYESQWYFLGIIVNLEKQKFEISLLQNNKVLHSKEYNLKQTNYGTDLYLILGGSSQIQYNRSRFTINIGQPLFNAQINKLSYFPGNYYYLEVYSYVIMGPMI